LSTPPPPTETYTLSLHDALPISAANQQARKACKQLLDGGLQPDGGINYGTWAKWIKRSETCVTGMVLSLLAYFEYRDPRLETIRSEEHTSELQSRGHLVCRLLLE